jgi:hypothetical protein
MEQCVKLTRRNVILHRADVKAMTAFEMLSEGSTIKHKIFSNSRGPLFLQHSIMHSAQ